MIKPVRLRPNLMAPTAFSTGKVFVMWDLHNCLIKSKQARYLVFGAQESSPTLLYNSWLHGRCQNLCWLGYACSGLPGGSAAIVEGAGRLCHFLLQSFQFGSWCRNWVKKADLRVNGAEWRSSAPCTFVLVSSTARYRETLVHLSNSGYNTLVVYNPEFDNHWCHCIRAVEWSVHCPIGHDQLNHFSFGQYWMVYIGQWSNKCPRSI